MDTLVNDGLDPGSLSGKLEEALCFLQQLMAENPHDSSLDLPVALIEEVIDEIYEYLWEVE